MIQNCTSPFGRISDRIARMLGPVEVPGQIHDQPLVSRREKIDVDASPARFLRLGIIDIEDLLGRFAREEHRRAESISALRRRFHRKCDHHSDHADDLIADPVLRQTIDFNPRSQFSTPVCLHLLRELLRLLPQPLQPMEFWLAAPRSGRHDLRLATHDVYDSPDAPTAVAPRRHVVDSRQPLTCRDPRICRQGRLPLETRLGLG